MTYRSKLAVLLLLLTSVGNVHAAYPIADVVDFPIDIVDTLEKVQRLQNEYEQYRVYQDTLAHYYQQAQKLKQAYDTISDLRLSTFTRILASEIFQNIMILDTDDQDLKDWLELADGASDLRTQLDNFRHRFRNVFRDFTSADAWQLGEFNLDEVFKNEDLLTYEAQHHHHKAALLQAWAHVGEGKFSHDTEGDKLSRVMDLWSAFQNDEQNLSGRQRGLDSANANAYALKEAQLKRLRALQGIVTMISLENSRRQHRTQHTVKKSVVMLQRLKEVADNWSDISDQVVF